MPNYSGIWTEQAVMQANGAGNWPNAPGAPTIGTATVLGATSVSVTFTAPTFAGIPATITGYTVTSSPGGLTGTGASSPITVAGLTTGTPYTFTVQATNASGTGPASAASNSVTPVQIDYVEDVFSTWLYSGTGSARTITNSINLSGNGGLVWTKDRTQANNNVLQDTVRGVASVISSNLTAGDLGYTNNITAFGSTGYSIGVGSEVNNSGGGGSDYVSWTFREQAKFFDVVTYTGNGSSQTISHNLGSTPGCIIIKSTSTAGTSWPVYHRGLATPNQDLLFLNQTASAFVAGYNNIVPSSTNFVVSLGDGDYNQSGRTYVAYLFAHDAGGFGLTGTDNVISCGSVTSDGSGSASVNLGWEPQWVLLKNATGAQYWYVVDNMRGLFAKFENGNALFPNSTSGETAGLGTSPWINSTGMEWNGSYNPLAASSTYIYIAIRRGPMKVPTVGTTVFATQATAAATDGTASQPRYTSNFPLDLIVQGYRSGGPTGLFMDRLRGSASTGLMYVISSNTDAEGGPGNLLADTMNGVYVSGGAAASSTLNAWMFRRAPSFFDEVCYTGTGTAGTTFNHNLTVAPELMIIKNRTNTADWAVFSYFNDQLLFLNLTNAGSGLGRTANSTTFTVGSASSNNASGNNYVAYLFATCAGVSKIGEYTGNGTTQTINCGFTGGARFVLIKRTNNTSGWYVYDTARGMTVLTDPYLLLNSTAAEVATLGSVTTVSTGFALNSAILADINVNGGAYTFLAIA